MSERTAAAQRQRERAERRRGIAVTSVRSQ